MSTLEKFIEEKWGLSEVTLIEALQKNGGREVFCLNASEDMLVVKLYHPALTEAEIQSHTDALLFLNESRFRHAPSLVKMVDGGLYTRHNGRFLYVMKYVQGRKLTENSLDEYSLGVTLARLHRIQNYWQSANLDTQVEKKKMLSRFGDYGFKEDYDRVVQRLPDFEKARQCFIHTDICPSNALRSMDGEIVLLDFDDAGHGSPYLDVGYPLITQFVKYRNRVAGQNPPNPDDLYFDREAARAFYGGYLSTTPLCEEERQLVFQGAVFMQLLYMPLFGEDAVPYLWRELDYALKNQGVLLDVLEQESWKE